jgi:hypothetical protein
MMNALVSRRKVMIGGVAAGSVIIAGGAFQLGFRAAPGALVLSQFEINVVEQASRVLFPDGFFPSAGGDGDTAQAVDWLLAEVIDPPAVGPFRSMLAALEWGTLVSRGTRFSALSVSEAKDVLDIWSSENPAPRRVAFDSLQAVLGMAFLRRPEVLEAIGWRAGCKA